MGGRGERDRERWGEGEKEGGRGRQQTEKKQGKMERQRQRGKARREAPESLAVRKESANSRDRKGHGKTEKDPEKVPGETWWCASWKSYLLPSCSSSTHSIMPYVGSEQGWNSAREHLRRDFNSPNNSTAGVPSLMSSPPM